MRVLALDVGEKRVGAAVSDPLGYSAQPLMVLARRPHGEFLKALAALAASCQAELVLLGLPRRTDGRQGPEAQRVLALAGEIRTKLGLDCATWDERFTTQAAERLLREGGLRREERRRLVDRTAAALILENFLCHQSSVAAPAPGGPGPGTGSDHRENKKSYQDRAGAPAPGGPGPGTGSDHRENKKSHQGSTGVPAPGGPDIQKNPDRSGAHPPGRPEAGKDPG